MKYNLLSASFCILYLYTSITEAIEPSSINPCTATLDSSSQQQLGYYDDGVTGRSTKSCHEICADSSNNYDSNGMCVLDRCYCTDVGIGTCQDNNHEGCDAICQNLSLDWNGVCYDGDCHCLY